ncbi:hypothetical protein RAH42_13195 (plasmid) [Pyramidobacter sp. YE332]|uniref:hypothetical protein n=1 Tax=Pyramidobacter sp. YE332 TaxID=3068894 RepID=UPI00294B0927|nr:hypothetical protein [Pyramidobacter sp. YE332]WOL41368.1 hypothetical protein RAH42_13195 [Pyramidobacter sp. YE332]
MTKKSWLLWLAAVVVVGLLAFIYWRQYQDWRETDALISRLRESAARPSAGRMPSWTPPDKGR